ncbi:MAG: hypothetical protein AAGK78_15790, partial [Planctomycetota bacterium]
MEPGNVCTGEPSDCRVDTTDRDNDGLLDLVEMVVGTDPLNADTDGDGLSDSAELAGGQPGRFDLGVDTDPLDADTDDDGLADGEEQVAGVDGFITDPRVPDVDADGLVDGLEVGLGPVPAGTSEGSAIPFRGTGLAFIPDADTSTTTDPLRADTDRGGVPDGLEDTTQNGRVDVNELDPNDPADDVQALCGNAVIDPHETCDDGLRLAGDGCSPLCLIEEGWFCRGVPSDCSGPTEDSDGDGLDNQTERRVGTDPFDADTDNDGLDDRAEIAAGDPTLFEPGTD